MKFYGTVTALISWKQIINDKLNKESSRLLGQPDRCYFEVDLNDEDREFLQENYWYVKEEGSEWPWNCRIAFED